jgi:hypothetical protein
MIFSLTCRLFHSVPKPDNSLLLQEVSNIRIATEQHLVSKSRLPVTFSLKGDILKFLFKSKATNKVRWIYLEKHDFPRQYFPEFWDHCADSHGQGVKVFYSIKVRHFITWSPKNYAVTRVAGKFLPVQRSFQEKMTLSFVKVALSRWFRLLMYWQEFWSFFYMYTLIFKNIVQIKETDRKYWFRNWYTIGSWFLFHYFLFLWSMLNISLIIPPELSPCTLVYIHMHIFTSNYYYKNTWFAVTSYIYNI